MYGSQTDHRLSQKNASKQNHKIIPYIYVNNLYLLKENYRNPPAIQSQLHMVALSNVNTKGVKFSVLNLKCLFHSCTMLTTPDPNLKGCPIISPISSYHSFWWPSTLIRQVSDHLLNLEISTCQSSSPLLSHKKQQGRTKHNLEADSTQAHVKCLQI